MKIANIAAFVSLLIVAAGCAYNRPGYATSPAYSGDVISSPGYPYPNRRYSTDTTAAERAAAYQRRVDQDLVNSVRDQFDHYGYLNQVAQNVDVTARSGTVTLAGSVPSRKDRDMIDAMVRNTRGVAAVNNLLEVTDPTLQPTARADGTTVYRNAGENISLHVQSLSDTDRQLAQRILSEFRNDPALASTTSPVDIYVADGWVTLQGGVASEAEKQMILAAVQRAAGMNVSNQLKVRPIVR